MFMPSIHYISRVFLPALTRLLINGFKLPVQNHAKAELTVALHPVTSLFSTPREGFVESPDPVITQLQVVHSVSDI